MTGWDPLYKTPKQPTFESIKYIKMKFQDPQNNSECGACQVRKYGIIWSCTSSDQFSPYCGTCPETLSLSTVHPQHPVTLVGAAPANLRCDLCSGLVKGMYYTCQINGRQCNFNLHPLCASLIRKYPPVRVHTLDPTHSLELKYLQPDGGRRVCDGCRKECSGWAYRCGVCSVDAHVGCVVSPAARLDIATPPAAAAYATSSNYTTAAVGQPRRKRDAAIEGLEFVSNVVDLINGVSQLLN